MGPKRNASISKPQKCLTPKNWRKYGTQIVLGTRKEDDRKQKFRVQHTKSDKSGSYIRFDQHPQPCIRAAESDDSLIFDAARTNSLAEWTFMIVKVKENGRWAAPSKDLKWDADSMSEIGSMLVAVYNVKKDEFLCHNKEDEVTMVKIDELFKDGEPEWTKSKLQKHNVLWQMDYTNSQWSAGEVTSGVLVPVSLTVAIGAVLAGGGLVLIVGAVGAMSSAQVANVIAVPRLQYLALRRR